MAAVIVAVICFGVAALCGSVGALSWRAKSGNDAVNRIDLLVGGGAGLLAGGAWLAGSPVLTGSIVLGAVSFAILGVDRARRLLSQVREELPVLVFTYRNAEGGISDKVVRDWSLNGSYLRGIDMDLNAERTYRTDRIVEWISGEEYILTSKRP